MPHNGIGFLNPTTCGNLEYRFVCLEKPELGTTWRNTSNVGTNPNGAGGVPYVVWVKTPVPNVQYKWAVIMRGVGCTDESIQSDWI
jgi:hypothetical protein